MLILLNDLTIDPDVQLKSRPLDPSLVSSYVEALASGAVFPPITVFGDGSTNWLSDGFHRVAAHRFLGSTYIEATRHSGTKQDASVFAATANVTNGRPMSQAEKREAGMRLIRMTNWSNYETGRRLAVPESTVRNWRASTQNCADTTRTVSRGGTTYTMDTSNIGRRPDLGESEAPQLALGLADDFAQTGYGYDEDTWDKMPEWYTGECYKQCYQPRVMVKGSIFDYGVRGVYVCSGCGYAYPPGSAPDEVRTSGNMSSSDTAAMHMAVHFSSESGEWLTPQGIIDCVIRLMGVIDLDPCSNDHDSPNVPAKTHFTREDDGLGHSWHGKVYMNPPYGREISSWVSHLREQWNTGNINEAIALLPARTDTLWFRELREYPRCFIFGRLQFSEDSTGAPFPSMVVYMGQRLDRFIQVFGEIGDVYILAGG